MTEDEVMEFLANEGYRPNRDGDYVIFKAESWLYGIDVDKEDHDFFRLQFPNFWELESDEEIAKGYAIANEVTDKIKGVKVIIQENKVFATVEIFFVNKENIEQALNRCIRAVQTAAAKFASAMTTSHANEDQANERKAK